MRYALAALFAAAAFCLLILAATTHKAHAAEDITVDTRCSDQRCTTYIERAAPGITVIPPVPHDAILLCMGTRCFTAPQPEHLPIEREHELQQGRRR